MDTPSYLEFRFKRRPREGIELFGVGVNPNGTTSWMPELCGESKGSACNRITDVALLLGFHSLVLKCLSKATGPKHTCQSLVGSDVLIITGPGNHHKRITLWCALILVDSI